MEFGTVPWFQKFNSKVSKKYMGHVICVQMSFLSSKSFQKLRIQEIALGRKQLFYLYWFILCFRAFGSMWGVELVDVSNAVLNIFITLPLLVLRCGTHYRCFPQIWKSIPKLLSAGEATEINNIYVGLQNLLLGPKSSAALILHDCSGFRYKK